jgi:hypothetical protein
MESTKFFVFLRLVLSVSLECSFSIAPSVFSNVYLRDNYILVILILQNEQYVYTAFEYVENRKGAIKNVQSRETGIIGYTRRRKTR